MLPGLFLEMAVILNIETSTDVCSVALTADGMVICHRENFEGHNHAALLSGFIKDCLDHAAGHDMRLDAVAVSIGPGSYTGLRIGLSEAKGLCYALQIPLIGVPSLKIMAVAVMFGHDLKGDELFVPMMDARRMEVYTAVYDFSLREVVAPVPLVLELDSYGDMPGDGDVLFFGNGSDKAKGVISNSRARFISGIKPLAVDMTALSEQTYMRRDFLDLAYCVPVYLKEFQATKPKKLF